MGKKDQSKKSRKKTGIQVDNGQKVEEESIGKPDVRGRLTLTEIDAISDEDGGDENDKDEWDAEAKALRQAISDGAFDKLTRVNKVVGGNEEDNEVIEESTSQDLEVKELRDDDSSDADEEDKENEIIKIANQQKLKALRSVTSNLLHSKTSLPWPEKFDIVPSTPLPFGTISDEGLVVDVHDDLKREMAFYNLALEAVHSARSKLEKRNIPFTRPADFYAEMVKTDDHMAMVKDRLIFENKKMDAFEQRKSNREQKLRAKEKHAHRLAEKAKAKKQNLQDVQDWADSAASNRIGGGRVRDNDDEYLNRMGGSNKKRQANDRKYGYGGKRGRFKQNDRKSMNDMSDYNPKGTFIGGKKAGTKKRKGKRARDAAKAKR